MAKPKLPKIPVAKLRIERTIKSTVKKCHAVAIKQFKTSKLPPDFPKALRPIVTHFYASIISCAPRAKKHKCLVVFLNDSTHAGKLPPYGKRKVWLRCDCEYFKFKCEYVLSKYGNTTRKYAINRPPTATNPRGIPYICKHLYMLLLLLRSRESR